VKSKVLADGAGKTFALVFADGDEFIATLTDFAKREGLGGSHFTGIGAFSDAVVGFFDWQRRDYDRISIPTQVEVLSLTGDIAIDRGEPKVHAHVVLGKRDGSAHGGHLLEAHVRPTLELTLVESPEHLRRSYDSKTGLALLDLSR
jgi:predicted DNA-binding protein with PD1-like motif